MPRRLAVPHIDLLQRLPSNIIWSDDSYRWCQIGQQAEIGWSRLLKDSWKLRANGIWPPPLIPKLKDGYSWGSNQFMNAVCRNLWLKLLLPQQVSVEQSVCNPPSWSSFIQPCRQFNMFKIPTLFLFSSTSSISLYSLWSAVIVSGGHSDCSLEGCAGKVLISCIILFPLWKYQNKVTL